MIEPTIWIPSHRSTSVAWSRTEQITSAVFIDFSCVSLQIILNQFFNFIVVFLGVMLLFLVISSLLEPSGGLRVV